MKITSGKRGPPPLSPPPLPNINKQVNLCWLIFKVFFPLAACKKKVHDANIRCSLFSAVLFNCIVVQLLSTLSLCDEGIYHSVGPAFFPFV